tara:strand:- start:67 stop:534 length:468 start_codon:yes stop_codon:yes gene_type:complete
VVVALVNSGNVSLARGDRESSDTLGLTSEGEVGDGGAGHGIPDMNGGHFTAFTRGNDVSVFSSGDIEGCDIILMDWPVRKILLSVFIFLTSTEESLLSSLQILNDGKGGSREHDLGVILTEVGTGLVSVSGETINVVDLIGTVWLTELSWVSLGC